jgi:hypothetical protein
MKCFQLICWSVAAVSALVAYSGSPLSEQNNSNTAQSDSIEAFRRAHTKDGITYTFNLPAKSELVVELPPPTRGATNTNYCLVESKDCHYLRTLIAPQPR